MPLGGLRGARLTGLWRRPDFVRLWAAATVSNFGSMVGRTAIAFTAILVLDASPLQIGLLSAAELGPALVGGLVAGAWVDRLRRRPLLIAIDLARAVVLLTVPVAAVAGVLSLGQLYAVAAVGGVLAVGFEVAHRAYLPVLVGREELVEANGRLTGGAAVAEAGAFAGGGWLVEWLSGPFALLIDAGSFVWSALLIRRIGTVEPRREADLAGTGRGLGREIGEGLRVLAADPTLRALAASNATLNAGYQVTGAVFLLYVTRELGLGPGVLGMIFAVGGGGALLGAVVSGRVLRLGVGPVLVGALLLTAAGQGLAPLASSTGALAIGLLIGQQIVADAAATVYEVGGTSLRQAMASERVLGRVTAGGRVLEMGAMLVGSLAGGLLGETVGLRPTLIVGVGLMASAAGWLWWSPVRTLRGFPALRRGPAEATVDGVAAPEGDDDGGPVS